MSNIKDSVGGIVSGASSVVSSGLNYLGINKDKGPSKSGGGSHMMGFGSDSYNNGSGGY